MGSLTSPVQMPPHHMVSGQHSPHTTNQGSFFSLKLYEERTNDFMTIENDIFVNKFLFILNLFLLKKLSSYASLEFSTFSLGPFFHLVTLLWTRTGFVKLPKRPKMKCDFEKKLKVIIFFLLLGTNSVSPSRESVEAAIADIKQAIRLTKNLPLKSHPQERQDKGPVWVPR